MRYFAQFRWHTPKILSMNKEGYRPVAQKVSDTHGRSEPQRLLRRKRAIKFMAQFIGTISSVAIHPGARAVEPQSNGIKCETLRQKTVIEAVSRRTRAKATTCSARGPTICSGRMPIREEIGMFLSHCKNSCER